MFLKTVEICYLHTHSSFFLPHFISNDLWLQQSKVSACDLTISPTNYGCYNIRKPQHIFYFVCLMTRILKRQISRSFFKYSLFSTADLVEELRCPLPSVLPDGCPQGGILPKPHLLAPPSKELSPSSPPCWGGGRSLWSQENLIRVNVTTQIFPTLPHGTE